MDCETFDSSHCATSVEDLPSSVFVANSCFIASFDLTSPQSENATICFAERSAIFRFVRRVRESRSSSAAPAEMPRNQRVPSASTNWIGPDMNAGLTASSHSSMLFPFSFGLQTTLLPVMMARAERSRAGDQTNAIATWYLPLFHDSDCLTHVAPKSGISALNSAADDCFIFWMR